MSDIFFGASTSLNRVSFLRSNSEFISSLLKPGSATRLTFYVQGNTNNVSPLLKGSSLLVADLNVLPQELIAVLETWSERNANGSPNLREEITAVFLGLDEDGASKQHLFSANPLESQLEIWKGPVEGTKHKHAQYEGTAYFAVDITLSNAFQDFLLKDDVVIGKNISDILALSNNQAALYGYGKTYIDWLMRNQRCPGCGAVVVPADAGTRLSCTAPTDAKCPVKRSNVNNVCFPRSDPVVIIGVVSSDGSKTLLGHNRRHPADADGIRMFSTIAGFMEPGETIEEAAVREIWEETGCRASGVQIINSQPWPFPASLMIGCVAHVEFNGINEVVNIDHDKEMEEAKWIDTELIREMVTTEDLLGKEGTEAEKIRLPFRHSIAFSLIKRIADGKV